MTFTGGGIARDFDFVRLGDWGCGLFSVRLSLLLADDKENGRRISLYTIVMYVGCSSKSRCVEWLMVGRNGRVYFADGDDCAALSEMTTAVH